MLFMSAERFRAANPKESIMSKTQAATPKAPGKCASLHAMWSELGNGEPLPRAFMIDAAVASGANPSTARTQAQAWLRTFQQREAQPELVGETTH